MAPPTKSPSQTSEIPPLRSIVFLGLIITSLQIIIGCTLPLYKILPKYLFIALALVFVAMCFSSIIGSAMLADTDTTRYRAAIYSHFSISVAIIFVLCVGKLIERGGPTGLTIDDQPFFVKTIIWTVTLGMWSAIWMSGGVEGLKREVKAIPGNLWLFLYE